MPAIVANAGYPDCQRLPAIQVRHLGDRHVEAAAELLHQGTAHLAFSLEAVIFRQLEDELAGAHNHLCPIRIRNNSPKTYGKLPKFSYSGGMSAAVRAPAPAEMPSELPETVPALFQRTAQRRGDAPALHFKAGERWTPISWVDYNRAVSRVANALLAEGLNPQDRVALWSSNRPEWQIADIGIAHAGLVTVAIYQSDAAEQVKYLLNHSESKVLIVEHRKLLDQVIALRPDLPGLQRVILIEGDAPEGEGWILTWEQALRRGDEFGRSRPGLLASRWQAVRPEDTASLIYTSGTTGLPKAAILTHRNLTWTAVATLQCFRGDPHDRVVSYLPLAHVLERVVSELHRLRGVLLSKDRPGDGGRRSSPSHLLHIRAETVEKDLRRHPGKDGQGQRTAAHDPGLGAADGRAAHHGIRAAQADGALGAMAVVAGGPVGVSKNPRDARLRQGRGLYQRLGRGITRHAPLLLRPRHRDPRGLRPDRDDRARLVQPAG